MAARPQEGAGPFAANCPRGIGELAVAVQQQHPVDRVGGEAAFRAAAAPWLRAKPATPQLDGGGGRKGKVQAIETVAVDGSRLP